MVPTKSDLAAAGFNREQALANLRRVSHHAQVFELSAKTGDGMQAWLDYLAERRAAPLRERAARVADFQHSNWRIARGRATVASPPLPSDGPRFHPLAK